MEFRLNRMHKSVELVYAFDVDYIHDPATVPEEFTRMLRSFPQHVVKSILLLAPAWYTGPSVDSRFYQERQQQESTWRKAGFDDDKGVQFPFGISPMHAYIEDAIMQNAFYEAKSILDRQQDAPAADYRTKPRLRICGGTGNLTHDSVYERPVSYTLFDMIGRFPKENPDKTKWGALGCPVPDDNCPSGDILMCMLDERGIQGSWVLTSLVGFLVIYFFLHAAAILHRKKNELQQLMKGPNKLMLTYQDVNFSEENSDNSKGGKNNKESKKDKKASRRQKASQGEEDEEDQERKKDEEEEDEGVNMTESSGNLCFLKGDIVYIKKFPTTFEPRQSFKRELKELRDLRHENINTFIGFYSGQTCCGLLMGYCLGFSTALFFPHF
ncbi:Oidioi.mRNA.OKI2018_I69.PAR.g13113.t1.cds [Oikopleura dioica]|uniref:Oidioi.mRNA.OKI2018_I69.PAR.g13113.t1.cds n=1 Tax=Oikopleura dioica TaxID=34765 RepID=A0ABN7S3B0_OIKDI|nr:Oidioi.mRNA.OKI2018_I69.PAR.g13113.t1.cds [Oikopleura dioica]